jgi:zinc transporter 1/2/3
MTTWWRASEQSLNAMAAAVVFPLLRRALAGDHGDEHGDEHGHEHGDEHAGENGTGLGAPGETEVYNVSQQVGGLFLVIAASVLGIVSSYVLARQGDKANCANSRAMAAAIVFVKGLSCGVVISVALVHLVSEAYEGFESAGWGDFGAWPMVFVMVGIYMMTAFDLIGHRFYANKSKCVEGASDQEHGHGHAHGAVVSDDAVMTKDGVAVTSLRVTAIIVEGGILLHSIIIGLDLGLQPEDSWAVILTAIALHQFLEGIMLGQVLGDLRNADRLSSRGKIWCMMLSFTLTTAVGIAIGIIVRTSMGAFEEPKSLDLAIAILNSLAGGLLLYMGIASLLVPWFVSSPSMRAARNLYVATGFIGLAVGLAAMTAVALAEGGHAH